MKKIFIAALFALATAHMAMGTIVRSLVLGSIQITIDYKNGCPSETVVLNNQTGPREYTIKEGCIIDNIAVKGLKFSSGENLTASQNNPEGKSPQYITINGTGNSEEGTYRYFFRFE